jgi:hypothetical protein
MSFFTSTEHFELHAVLSKLVRLEKISEHEMENILIKAGLTKISDNIYKDELGSVLSMIN